MEGHKSLLRQTSLRVHPIASSRVDEEASGLTADLCTSLLGMRCDMTVAAQHDQIGLFLPGGSEDRLGNGLFDYDQGNRHISARETAGQFGKPDLRLTFQAPWRIVGDAAGVAATATSFCCSDSTANRIFSIKVLPSFRKE